MLDVTLLTFEYVSDGCRGCEVGSSHCNNGMALAGEPVSLLARWLVV